MQLTNETNLPLYSAFPFPEIPSPPLSIMFRFGMAGQFGIIIIFSHLFLVSNYIAIRVSGIYKFLEFWSPELPRAVDIPRDAPKKISEFLDQNWRVASHF